MSRTMLQEKTISRTEAIDRLRNELTKLADDENSVCKVAAKKGIFCKGFHRSSDGGLRRCYSWLDKRRPGMSREELEDLANRWQLARQEVNQLPIACDVQQKEHDSCNGWDDFTNKDLATFYFELTGAPIAVG